MISGDVASIGATIKASRKRGGWSQTDLARTAGLSRPTIARIETGQDISATSLAKIAGALDMTLRLLPATHHGAGSAERGG